MFDLVADQIVCEIVCWEIGIKVTYNRKWFGHRDYIHTDPV